MLTKEHNDLLTLTGAGTPAGDLMRRYWQPAALADEVALGGPPVPIRLLGEDLVVYRDGKGQLGVLSRRCSHRGADLGYGEVEDEGLRCYYHGWLYDAQGHCLDQPLEPPDNDFKDTIQHLAYPCVEKGGVIFAYLGPDEPPLLPAYEFLSVPDQNRRSTKYLLECNYLQAAEGSVDPVQLLMFRQLFGGGATAQLALALGGQGFTVESELTEFGLRLFAMRKADANSLGLELRDFMLPAVTTLSGVGIDGYAVHWHVPIDDTHHWRYVFAFRRGGPMSDEDGRRNGIERVEGYRLTVDLKEPPTDDPNFVAYAITLAESQGPLYDRTQEHLVETDEGLIALRAVVHKAIQDVQEGADPPHVVREEADNAFEHIQAVETAVPAKSDWRSQFTREGWRKRPD